MKKIYTEKIHQSTRFGLIDEDGRKTPCGTLWSDAQRETFERLMMNGGNNLAFMAWDSGKRNALWAKWTDARGQEKLCKLGTFKQNAPMKEFVEVATATADTNKCCATCGHYERVNRHGQINCGMGVCTLINRDRYCLFKCGEWSMKS